MFLSLSRKSKSNRRKLASNESHVRASHAARKTAIRKAYRFCKRETLHQTSAGFHVRRLINARFHPACRSPSSPTPPPALEKKLSPGSARWSVIVIPNDAALMDIASSSGVLCNRVRWLFSAI